MSKLQEFYLFRKTDVSGVSGTGVVARGVVLGSHRAVLEWCTSHETLGVYDNLQQIEDIHGHDGKTEVILGTPPKNLTNKGKKK